MAISFSVKEAAEQSSLSQRTIHSAIKQVACPIFCTGWSVSLAQRAG